MSLISDAARMASIAHAGQYRKYSHSNEPYVTHPMRVAGRVSLVEGATHEMIAAAWLHDTIEDTEVTSEELLKGFPPSVVKMVEELTNPSIPFKGELNRAARRKMDHEHLAKVSREAKIIKLADRIDNLSDLGPDSDVPEGFKKLYLKESETLLEALRGVDDGLEMLLESLIKEYS